MKLDMDLAREILLTIEEQDTASPIYDLKIGGYERENIAYHCKTMYEKGLISDYKAQYADNKIYIFGVGPLTWEGNDYLNNIRDNTFWGTVKSKIKENGLSLTFETVKTVSTAVISSLAEGVTNAFINNGGKL